VIRVGWQLIACKKEVIYFPLLWSVKKKRTSPPMFFGKDRGASDFFTPLIFGWKCKGHAREQGLWGHAQAFDMKGYAWFEWEGEKPSRCPPFLHFVKAKR
jgi:hypothetical protein